MTKYIPPGFDAAAARSGILKAMGFGEPTRADDKATFFFPKSRTSNPTTAAHDQDGVPFDPTVPVATADSKTKVQVACAIEVGDGTETIATYGSDRATRITITLLDDEYQQVKGFAYVVAGGDKYLYDWTEPPVALGTIDVWTVHCTAEDES